MLTPRLGLEDVSRKKYVSGGRFQFWNIIVLYQHLEG
jgi:hypothetical protein